MVVDGYIRVSRVAGREGDTFISPDVQREQIEAWARAAGATVALWHSDLDMSGARADRPGLQAALERVEQKETDGVVVARLDRLARSLTVAFEAITRIEAAGGTLVAVADGIDPRTPTGKMARSILLVIAEWYREQIRESWQVARERAVRRGVTISSTVATGYRRGDDGSLEIDSRWAAVVKEVFERRAGGESWAQLAQLMNTAGVPVRYAKAATGRWTGATVSRLVAGRVYLGESRHGEFVNATAHEALISLSLWHAAQAARGVQAPRSVRHPALLAGLVRCAGCGYGMYRNTGRGGNGSISVHYRCRGACSAGRCDERALVIAWDLEALVIREFMRRASQLSVIGSQNSADLDAAVTELDEAEEALRIFRDDPRIIAALGADHFAAGLRQRAQRVDEFRERVAAARLPMGGVPDVVTLRGLWPDLDVCERRRLLTAAIDCGVVAGGGRLSTQRVRLCWSGLAPEGLPRRGARGSSLRPICLDDLPAETRPTATS